MNFLTKMTMAGRRSVNATAFNVAVQRQNSMMLPVSQRMIHQRGYTNFDDNFSFHHNEVNFALMNAKNTPDIAYVYEKYGELMTDK